MLHDSSNYMFKMSTGWLTNISAVACGSLPQCCYFLRWGRPGTGR